ncbi:MAG: 16S rRNA (cytosine(1402)-N(4))-methyltransferase RsmH [Candidatus Eisenbacteria bacterium]|uniref:Ribosomal RNA small subunit methyltransferase H n=1 Tax=Eiseniibacteriota bacterium TaxID=2212470 RepID=A0A9D6QLZ5_UNCEI|nr:16S rRNA (cytosine(1402)-N(4))-methyltransferase RsmH [Candidatus Eisenbacteria bacterium]
MSARHEPVLVGEVLRFLVHGRGLYLDATLGDGGHAEALLDAEPGARLLGADRDPDALAASRPRLARFGERVMLAHATFRELPAAHAGMGGEPFTGALFDLGLSSRQIDTPERGIAFMSDGPLDMRMDARRGEPASARLATADEAEIAAALRDHGDLPQGRRLARAIVAAARSGELPSTRSLATLVDRVLGGRTQPRRTARVFQALRMWINDEAAEIEAALEWLPGAMKPGGVVVTLAYHSGEDRRIKQALRGRPETAARRLLRLPVPRPPEGPWQELTRTVVTPTLEEQAANPRARSARLRAFRRKSA